MEKTQREPGPAPQSFGYYIPIVVVIGLGYFSGGFLTFGVQWLGLFPTVHDSLGRLTMVLFGSGMLGGAVYVTRWWAKDIDDAAAHPKFLPNPLDWFGYLTTIVGGGILGVVLYLAVRGGVFLLAPSGNRIPELRLSAAIVISFSGGLLQFKVQELLNEAVRRIGRESSAAKADGRSDSSPPDDSATSPH